MRNLHEKAGDKRFTNVGIVIFRGEITTSSWKRKSIHDS